MKIKARTSQRKTNLGITLAGVGVAALIAVLLVVRLGPDPRTSSSASGFSSATPRHEYAAAESWSHIGESATVRYTVASPFRSQKGTIFLNERRDYRNGFVAVIFASDAHKWSGDPISLYGYKEIRVAGKIGTYEGHPEIIVNDPSQIRLAR